MTLGPVNVGVYTNLLVARAHELGPRDAITQTVGVIQAITSTLLLPLFVAQIISTLVLGILAGLTFGLVLLPFSLLWLILLGPLFATSWLWVKVPLLRPVLLLPGGVYSSVLASYAGLMPEMGDWEARAMKQALCGAWPSTIYVFQADRALREALERHEDSQEVPDGEEDEDALDEG